MRTAAALLFALLAAPALAQPCDPAATDEVCPDTTDWRRYLPPLAVGNQWQYDYEGLCSEIEPCRTGREVTGSRVIEGVERFLVRRCSQYIEGNITCTEPALVSYEDYSSEECILSLPFNYSGVSNCYGTDSYYEAYGRYDGVFNLGEGPSITGSVKTIIIEGTGVTYFAGVGETYALGDGSGFGTELIYARIDGVEYGMPAFPFPTLSEPGTAQPVATAFTQTFPNPARGMIRAQYALEAPQAVTLDLIDLLGRRVRTVEVGPQPAGIHDVRLDLGGLRAGLYVLRLRGDAGDEATQRIVVIR